MLREAGVTVIASGDRSVAVRQSSGIVQTGDRARAFQGQAAALGRPQEVPVPVPALVGLPKPPVKTFVGRSQDLERLGVMVMAGAGAVTQSRAVHGLGGVGKSELALQFAFAHRTEYALVWWVTADNPAAIESGLAELAYRLHPDAQVTATDQEAARWAMGWLQAHPGWLLVLDNVEHRHDVEPLLGHLSGGEVLITTRRDVGWEDITDGCLRVEVLSPQAAVELLLALSGQRDERPAAVLAAELGCLPLALRQAGAYLRETRLDLDAYLRDLRRDPARTLRNVAADDPAERAVARVWSVTLRRIGERDPLAVEVLNLLAWLAPDDFPREVLHGLTAGRSEVGRALGVLASYNMVTLTRTTVAVHRLVQSVIRGAAVADGSAALVPGQAIDLLAEAAPDDPISNVAGWPRWASLLPHISVLSNHLPADHQFPAMFYLQERAATYRLYQGDVLNAIADFERVLADRRRVLGEDHPSTLTTRHNLAGAYETAGRVAEAISEFEQVLVDQLRVLGEDHPSTLTNRHNLAGAYETAGRVAEAISEFEQVLVDQLRVFGEDHPGTLATRHDLAYAYATAGRLAGAITEYERVLADARRVLGEDHPTTQLIRDNLKAAQDLPGSADPGRG